MKVTRKSLTKRPGDFAVTFEKTNNPLKGNRNLSESHQVTEVTAPERADPPETLRPVWRSRARSAAGWYGQGWGQAAPGMRPLLAQGPSTMSMWKTDRFALGVAGCAMRGIFLCRVDRAVFCGDKNEKRPENSKINRWYTRSHLAGFQKKFRGRILRRDLMNCRTNAHSFVS